MHAVIIRLKFLPFLMKVILLPALNTEDTRNFFNGDDSGNSIYLNTP